MAKIDIFNPESKYDILYTDPPWQQGRGGKKAARPNSTGTTVHTRQWTSPELWNCTAMSQTNS